MKLQTQELIALMPSLPNIQYLIGQCRFWFALDPSMPFLMLMKDGASFPSGHDAMTSSDDSRGQGRTIPLLDVFSSALTAQTSGEQFGRDGVKMVSAWQGILTTTTIDRMNNLTILQLLLYHGSRYRCCEPAHFRSSIPTRRGSANCDPSIRAFMAGRGRP